MNVIDIYLDGREGLVIRSADWKKIPQVSLGIQAF
jgi:hypothetical protein